MNSSPDKTYRRFLLGIASEEEECRVEEAVLTGEVDALVLQAAEDELIDDYLLGSVTHEERRGFEEKFLITEQRKERFRFASELIEYSQKPPVEDLSVKSKPAPLRGTRFLFSWKRAALLSAAASVLLAVLVGVGSLKLRRQTQAAQETQKELTRLQVATIAGRQDTASMTGPPAGIQGGAERGGDRMPIIEFASTTRAIYPALFRVPEGTRFAQIDWKLSAPFAEKYREVLLSEGGHPLWSQEFPAAVLSPAKLSTIVLPASILVPGTTYHLRLEGSSARGQFEEQADCVFRVVRE